MTKEVTHNMLQSESDLLACNCDVSWTTQIYTHGSWVENVSHLSLMEPFDSRKHILSKLVITIFESCMGGVATVGWDQFLLVTTHQIWRILKQCMQIPMNMETQNSSPFLDAMNFDLEGRSHCQMEPEGFLLNWRMQKLKHPTSCLEQRCTSTQLCYTMDGMTMCDMTSKETKAAEKQFAHLLADKWSWNYIKWLAMYKPWWSLWSYALSCAFCAAAECKGLDNPSFDWWPAAMHIMHCDAYYALGCILCALQCIRF